MENESSDLKHLYAKWKFGDKRREENRARPRQEKLKTTNEVFLQIEELRHLKRPEKDLIRKVMEKIVPPNLNEKLTILEIEELARHSVVEFSKEDGMVTLKLSAKSDNEQDIIIQGRLKTIFFIYYNMLKFK